MGQRHWAAWLISGLGLVLAALSMWYLIVVRALYLGAVADQGPAVLLLNALEVLLLAGFSLVLVYAGYWLATSTFEEHRVWWAGLWTMVGLAGIVTLVTFGVTVQLSQGRYVSDPTLVQELLLAAGGGALAGLLIGISTLRETVESEEARNQRDALLFVNELLRHNVLNGMQVIMANTDRLERAVDDEDARALLEANEDRAETIVDLVENVRALVRSVSNEVDLMPVSLTTVLRTEARALRQAHPDAAVTVDIETDVAVTADELLPAVFENVLNNAVEHNDSETPEVVVTVTADATTVTVRVADNGPGIDDDRKTAYFDAGEQAPESVGQGLGLYLVDVLVDRYGGSVRIEDDEPRGAVVVLEFERAQ
ncbi:sensor histidine kinase [Halorarius halobius]|uniref:sensor histidine kinase n=1 Tax=Halorarius halobius TaxID=2962671 RepID=UPI0020CFBFBD|nr:HAMP domain-containing sensor histidine kinase [Halorarius halobius]